MSRLLLVILPLIFHMARPRGLTMLQIINHNQVLFKKHRQERVPNFIVDNLCVFPTGVCLTKLEQGLRVDLFSSGPELRAVNMEDFSRGRGLRYFAAALVSRLGTEEKQRLVVFVCDLNSSKLVLIWSVFQLNTLQDLNVVG